MLLLGHTGISLLAAWLADSQIRRSHIFSSDTPGASIQANADALPNLSSNSNVLRPQPIRAIDYRLVLIGALLPDIIDKPLAFLILPDVFTSTRALAHTSLFNAVLLVTSGVLLTWLRTPALLILALASTGHLALDSMWSLPEVLWWPYYGWGFPASLGPSVGLLERWLDAVTQPGYYMFEAAGGTVLAAMSIVLLKKKGWTRLLQSGKPWGTETGQPRTR